VLSFHAVYFGCPCGSVIKIEFDRETYKAAEIVPAVLSRCGWVCYAGYWFCRRCDELSAAIKVVD